MNTKLTQEEATEKLAGVRYIRRTLPMGMGEEGKIMNTKTQRHTATPWKITKNIEDRTCVDMHHQIVGDGIAICDLFFRPDSRDAAVEQEANAELIVRAVNAHAAHEALVEAARGVLALWRKLPGTGTPFGYAAKKLREALALAEAKS